MPRRPDSFDSGDLLTDGVMSLLAAIIDGLRLALCSPQPMSVARAREVLDGHLASMRLRASDLGLVSPPSCPAMDA